MTIAGYWFDSRQADRFGKDWSKVLNEFGLSYAHMTDCALGYGQYRKLSMNQRIRVQKLLIENIKRRTRFGFAVTIDPNLYADVMAGVVGAPSCYTLCLMLLVNQVASFAMVNKFDGKLKYIFESGHESAREADKYLSAISWHGSAWLEATRYSGHWFADKRSAMPLQAADMLAWQVRHFFCRSAQGHTKPRKDLVALLRPFDLSAEVGATSLLALRDAFSELVPIVEQGDNLQAALKANDIFDRHGLFYRSPPKFKL